jgi:hypothetical protein
LPKEKVETTNLLTLLKPIGWAAYVFSGFFESLDVFLKDGEASQTLPSHCYL